MSLWDLTAAIGAGLAFASFIVLCIVMFLSRHDAPNYWGEKPTLNDNDRAGTLTPLMRPADDPREKYKRAERRLRDVLLGDGMFEPGAVKGEERRVHVAADLRRMREAFDEVTQHEEGLAEELLEAARRKTKRKTKPPPRTRS